MHDKLTIDHRCLVPVLRNGMGKASRNRALDWRQQQDQPDEICQESRGNQQDCTHRGQGTLRQQACGIIARAQKRGYPGQAPAQQRHPDKRAQNDQCQDPEHPDLSADHDEKTDLDQRQDNKKQQNGHV
jgi:hypothetical protein